MSTASPKPASPPPTLLIVLIPIAVLPYAMMMSGIGGLHDVDGISRGLAGIYALVAIVILWILLAVSLVNAAVAGEMPGWARLAALLLHPLSFVATIVALDLLSGDTAAWTILAPAALPPLLAFYALWARLPRLHAVLPPGITSVVLWGAVSLLSIAPLIGIALRERAIETHKKEIPFISDEQRREQARQERLARFEALTPASPLENYLQYLRGSDELRDRALAAARRLDKRQAEAEAMLRKDEGLDVVRNLAVLDLEATPQLCAAANDYLTKRSASVRPRGAEPTFWWVEDELEILMPGFEWLVAQHCEIDEALAEMEATVRAYPETSYAANRFLIAGRERYLGDLARLRQAVAR